KWGFQPCSTSLSTERESGCANSGFEFLQLFIDLVPVDNVPPGRNVVGAPVLVFQIIRMLPDIEAQNRLLAFHERTVLIWSGDDFKTAVAFHEPCPAGTESAGGRRGEFFFEAFKSAETG